MDPKPDGDVVEDVGVPAQISGAELHLEWLAAAEGEDHRLVGRQRLALDLAGRIEGQLVDELGADRAPYTGFA